MWNINNYEFLLSSFQEVIELYENRGGNELTNLGSDNFNTLYEVLSKV